MVAATLMPPYPPMMPPGVCCEEVMDRTRAELSHLGVYSFTGIEGGPSSESFQLDTTPLRGDWEERR